MKKIISKTNFSLLIIVLSAMLFCGLFAINAFKDKRQSATAYEAGSSATIIGWASRSDDGLTHSGGSLSTKLSNFTIKNITITNDSMPGNYETIIDVSYNSNNTIHAYLINNADGTYNCIIYANVETIYAPSLSFGMFEDMSKLESINFECFDTSNVIEMCYMFSGCSSLKSLDLSNFNTSKVDDMRGMFSLCSSLEQLNLNSFNTSKVTRMRLMFCSCESLLSIDISDFDTRNVTEMSLMFYGCSSLISLDLSSFATSKVTDMNSMFYDCQSLITIMGLDGFDTSKVTDMIYMFAGCASLDVLDLSSFNFSSIPSYDYIFGMLGINDAFILAMCDSLGDAGVSLKPSYQQAIDNNSVEGRIQVVAYALQNLYGRTAETSVIEAGNCYDTNIQTIYAPTSLNSMMVSLPFNNNAQYVYNNGTSEVETSFLVGRDTAEELAIYVKGETPLAKPEASAPSVTPETGFVDEQLLPAMAIGLASIVAVVVVFDKKRKHI